MYLKFLGTDNSMGLINGKVYDVEIKSRENFIWVIILNFKLANNEIAVWKCPYTSPQNFAANWGR